jgi:choice-of-anchor B domain-containing protein
MNKVYSLMLLLFLQTIATAQFNLNLKGHLPYPSNTCAGIWHYVDSLGNEYALVGVNDRLAIVDVTVATNPIEILSVPALPGQSSLWREVKTAGKYAYAVSEGGGGVMIIDLSYLPDSVPSKHYYGDGLINNQLGTAHTIAVTDGYAYVFGTGGGLAAGGAVILDLADPWNPVYVGQYNLNYIHDGYIRGDTLWAGEIYAGLFSVVDISDKTNPVLLATQSTPGQFCHNTWLSDNSQFLFTTDELPNKPLGSFDVSNLGNIKLVDEYFTDSMPASEVHNVRVLNDFLINPSYGSQLTICDAARPDNIIEIASYPTGSYLCWDASPYLPSGNIIVADVDGGVYVLEPNYVRACYLEGNVTDSITGLPLSNVNVSILPTDKKSKTNLSGDFKTGLASAGTFDIEFRKPGYITKTLQGVVLTNGQLTLLNVVLSPFVLLGTVTEQGSGNPIPGASVFANDGDNSAFTIADGSGNFSFTTLSSGMMDITATSWGHNSFCQSVFVDGQAPVVLSLSSGYYDDFITDLGWTVNSTVSNGDWERGIPVATSLGAIPLNPGFDVSNDCGEFAFVTGNGGGSPSNDNVDDGYTELVSPFFDLSTYADPYINYSRWFACPPSVPLASRDTMFISLENGVASVQLESVSFSNPGVGTWVNSSFRVLNFITPGTTMKLRVSISDKAASGNYLEGGFDKFSVTEGTQSLNEVKSGSLFSIYPNPGNGAFRIRLKEDLNGRNPEIRILDITGRVLYAGQLSSDGAFGYGTENLAQGVYLVAIVSEGKLLDAIRYIKSR